MVDSSGIEVYCKRDWKIQDMVSTGWFEWFEFGGGRIRFRFEGGFEGLKEGLKKLLYSNGGYNCYLQWIVCINLYFIIDPSSCQALSHIIFAEGSFFWVFSSIA